MTFRNATAALLALFSAAAWADPIATDRPDFVESSNTVGAGRWQLETSIAYESDQQSGVEATTWSTPTLLRIGMGEYLEARIETDGLLSQDLDGNGINDSNTGYADTAIGLKWHVPGSENSGPSLGVLLHADLDNGSSDFRGGGVRPSLRVVAEWELSERVSLGIMPGVISDKDDNGERFTAGILGAVVGYAINDSTRVFAEIAAEQIAADNHGGDVVNFDIGTAHLLSEDAQVDLAASFGMTEETPEWAVTVGYSVRF